MMRFLFSVFLLFVSVSFSFAQDDPGNDVKMFLNQINREIDNKTRSLNARGILYLAYSDTCLVRWREDNLNFKNECKEYVREIDRAYAGFSGYLDKIAKDCGEIGFDKKEFMTGEYLYYYMTYPAFFYSDINRKIRNLKIEIANADDDSNSESTYSAYSPGILNAILPDSTVSESKVKVRPRNSFGLSAGLFVNKLGTGYAFGIEYDIFMARNFAFSLGASYYGQSKKNGEYVANSDRYVFDYGGGRSPYMDKKIKANFISVPVGFKYYKHLSKRSDKIKLIVFAGGELFYGISMKESVSVYDGERTSVYDSMDGYVYSFSYRETKNLFSGKVSSSYNGPQDIYDELHSQAMGDDLYKRWDVCLSLGVGFHFGFGEIWAGYKRGLTDFFLSPDDARMYQNMYKNMFYFRFRVNITR